VSNITIQNVAVRPSSETTDDTVLEIPKVFVELKVPSEVQLSSLSMVILKDELIQIINSDLVLSVRTIETTDNLY
ncbi:hypothetical protein C4579_01065, partial [Candidatus Microgenomates bacterium]